MTSLSGIKDTVAGAARTQARNYSPDQPLGGYAATMTVFGALVAGLAAAAKLSGRPAPGLTRAAIDVFAGLAGADILQFTHAWPEKKSSRG